MPRHFSEPFEPEDLFEADTARELRRRRDEERAEWRRRAEQMAADDAMREAEARGNARLLSNVANRSVLEAEYRRAGVQAIATDASGMPTVSLSLLLQLGWSVHDLSGEAVLVWPTWATDR